MSACPICGSESRALGLVPARFPLRRCRRCGHRFAELDGYDVEGAYVEGYEGFRDDATFDARIRAFLEQHLLPRAQSGPLLDVGCGGGTVLRIAGGLGFDALGFDLSEAAVEACRSKGLQAIAGDFTRHDFADRRFRVITFWDVLEHLPEPGPFLARAHALLEPGGWLIAKVPLHGDWSLRTAGAVPRLAAPVLGVPVHVQFYTQESLDELLGPRFVQKRWIELGPMREGASGGRVRRRLARRVVRSIHALSGDGNLVVVAQRPRTSVATS
jgi:SAM-dependent methyltransferase